MSVFCVVMAGPLAAMVDDGVGIGGTWTAGVVSGCPCQGILVGVSLVGVPANLAGRAPETAGRAGDGQGDDTQQVHRHR